MVRVIDDDGGVSTTSEFDVHVNNLTDLSGRVYEDRNENGVMVWQDFAMACAVYPQTDEFAVRIRREAEAIVTKLRNHPSLVLWSGNNEVDMAQR